MIVMVMVVKGNGSKSNIFGFCSDCNSSNGKVNKRRTIYEKLVGNGSVTVIMSDAIPHAIVIT